MLCGGLRWGNFPLGPLAVEIAFGSNSGPNFCADCSLRTLFEVMMVLLCGTLGGWGVCLKRFPAGACTSGWPGCATLARSARPASPNRRSSAKRGVPYLQKYNSDLSPPWPGRGQTKLYFRWNHLGAILSMPTGPSGSVMARMRTSFPPIPPIDS